MSWGVRSHTIAWTDLSQLQNLAADNQVGSDVRGIAAGGLLHCLSHSITPQERASLYARKQGLQVEGKLGFGNDGTIWTTSCKLARLIVFPRYLYSVRHGSLHGAGPTGDGGAFKRTMPDCE